MILKISKNILALSMFAMLKKALKQINPHKIPSIMLSAMANLFAPNLAKDSTKNSGKIAKLV